MLQCSISLGNCRPGVALCTTERMIGGDVGVWKVDGFANLHFNVSSPLGMRANP